MEVLGEVFIQVMVFSTGLLVLAVIAIGIYMRMSGQDPLTGRGMPQPRVMLLWRNLLFSGLGLFSSFLSQLVPKELLLLQIALLAAGVLFMATGLFFLIKFLRYASR